MSELENINPNVYKRSADRKHTENDENDDVVDPFDEREIFGKWDNLLKFKDSF